MNDFLRQGFNLKRQASSRSIFQDKFSVMVKYHTGKIVQYNDISDPWRYIAKVKKNVEVADAWIKE